MRRFDLRAPEQIGLAIGAAVVFLRVSGAAAQTGGASEPPEFQNPPALLASPPPALGALNALALMAPATGRNHLDLQVVYTLSKIWNPAANTFDTVKLRSYSGRGVNPGAPYVAPLIEVKPGDRVNITLHNDLPADPTCTAMSGSMDTPHCFNGTNLHSHGLWVSPAGNSDNVLLSINPGVSFEYEYDLPADHPSGTFWYHSHRHGSTALQVSSGMAGALIVRGHRFPTPTSTGDIDTLLDAAGAVGAGEKILVLQQIQYACRDKDGKIKVQKDGSGNVIAWVCDHGDVGGIENYDGFGPPSWAQSGRFTTINGQVRPRFEAVAGSIERWRIIHGGVRDTISLSFRPRDPAAPSVDGLTSAQSGAYIDHFCQGPQVPFHLVAADGLSMGAARKVSAVTFQPGYRWDALVVFPRAGSYCVINESAPAAGSVSRKSTDRALLATVRVSGGEAVGDVSSYLQDKLVAAAQRAMPANVRAKVTSDLQNGLRLASFVPHPDIQPQEVTGKQELVFDIAIPASGAVTFGVANGSIDPKHFDPGTFKPQPYDPNRVDRVLTLGGVDEWTLQSAFVSHPFHIHVNPFQIVDIIDPNGRDVSAPDATDDAGGQPADPQYPGLKGVWKDTLWVKDLIANPADFPGKLPQSIYTIHIRTRYQRFIGDYVLHCHILDHEDQGMMQNVRVVLPSGP
jgi:FtsP/CotA-like multicopper oxidase with cupredoxin domain